MKTKLIAAAVILLLIASGWIYSWYRPPLQQTVYRMRPAPYVAPPSFERLNISSVVVPVPEGIVALQPTPKQRAKIEAKIGGPLPPDTLLGLKEVGPLPYGANLALTLKPSTNEDGTPGPGEVVATVYPRKAPFFQWAPARTLSVWGGVGGSSSGSTAGQLLGAEFRQDLFRTGMIQWDARAGAIHLVGQDTMWYAAVGAKVTF